MKSICNECGFAFELTDDQIKTSNLMIKNVKVHLIYFMCKNCNHIYRVCVYEDDYFGHLNALENAKENVKKNYGSRDLLLAQKLNDELLSCYYRLKRYLSYMKRKYDGTFTLLVSENKQEIFYHENKHG